MASNVVKALTEDFLHCSICMNRFKDPKVLPCIHSFCQECLEKYVERLKSDKLPCPTCRKVCDLMETGVKGLQTNFHLVNLGERMDLLERLDSSKSNSYTFDSCEATVVVVYCLECDFKLCSICQTQHKKFPTLRSHTLVPIKEIKKPKYQQALQNAKAPHCDLHPTESLRFYCKKCSKLICRDCTIVQHPKPDHECVEASCQLQDVKLVLSTLLNESALHLDQNLKFIRTGQDGLENVAEKSAIVRQEVKHAYENMTAAIEKQLKDQMENMCRNITDAEEKQKATITEKVRRASTWVTSLRNIQKVTQKLIDENNMYEILGMSSNIISAFDDLKGDSVEFSWHQYELKQRHCFFPQTVPSVDLGQCRNECEAVVLSDSQGNFFICSVDRRTSTVCLLKLRKDNDYSWDKADRIASHRWDAVNLSNTSLTADIERNNQVVFVGMGKSIGVFNLSTKSFSNVMMSEGSKAFKHISWLGVEENSCVMYVKELHESRVQKFYYDIGYEEQFCDESNIYEEEVPIVLSDSGEKGWSIPADHSRVNNIICYNKFLLCTLDKKDYPDQMLHTFSSGKSVHLLKKDECVSVQPPQPVSLVSARMCSIMKGHLESPERRTQTYSRNYGSHKRYQNTTMFSCYVLWCGTKKTSKGSGKMTYVITKYDSQQHRNIQTWEASEESGLPVVCYHDTSTAKLKICDTYGTVTTCFKCD